MSARKTAANWTGALERATAGLPTIDRFETVTIAGIHGDRFHSSPCHELIHVQQGRAEIRYRRRSFRVAPGDTFIIPRGTPHRDIRSDETPCRFTYVFFDWPTGDRVIAKLVPRACLEAPAGVRFHLHMLMGEFEAEYLGDAAGAPDRMRVLLLEVVLAMVRCSHRALARIPGAPSVVAGERRRSLASQMREFLIENYDQAVSLDALAEKHDVSAFHLSRTFSREFGVSMTDMLTMIRIERAKELLRRGELSVKEIARRAGYSNGNYFAKVFRRACGFSPSEYRVLSRRSAGGGNVGNKLGGKSREQRPQNP